MASARKPIVFVAVIPGTRINSEQPRNQGQQKNIRSWKNCGGLREPQDRAESHQQPQHPGLQTWKKPFGYRRHCIPRVIELYSDSLVVELQPDSQVTEQPDHAAATPDKTGPRNVRQLCGVHIMGLSLGGFPAVLGCCNRKAPRFLALGVAATDSVVTRDRKAQGCELNTGAKCQKTTDQTAFIQLCTPFLSGGRFG